MAEAAETPTASHWTIGVRRDGRQAEPQPLPDGSYVVGRSLECDLILWDPDLAGRHFQLHVAGDELALEPEAGAVLLDGDALTGQSVVTADESILTAGATILVLRRERTATPDTSAEADRDGSPGDLPTEIATGRQRGAGRLSLAPFLALIVAGMAGATVFGASSIARTSSEAGRASPAAEKLHRADPDGSRPPASDRLAAAQAPIDHRPGTIKAVRELIAGKGERRVVVQAGTGGAVILRGYVSDDQARIRLLQTVAEDISGYSRLESPQLRTADEVAGILNGELAAAGLEGVVVAVAAGAEPVLESAAPKEKIRGLSEVLAKAEADLGFSVDPAIRPPSGGLPDIEIRSVWSGSRPYLQLVNGEIYLEGAVLPDGWRVSTIVEAQVSLEKNGRIVRFDVADQGADHKERNIL